MRPPRNATPGPRRTRTRTRTGIGTGAGVAGGIAIADTGPTTRRLRLTERDNHTTVTVPVGTRLDVTLASTYWSLSSSSPAMLQAVGATRYPRGACRPGAGCGSTQLTLLTRTGGTSDVVGLRTSCGEAVRCAAATGRYLVNVHVLARRP